MKTPIRSRYLLLCVIATAILGMSPRLSAEYRIIDLGTLGGNSSEANDLNDQGQIVGSSGTASGQTHAFFWQRNVMTDLGTLGGAYSSAVDINARGQVVGSSDTALGIPPLRRPHAFLWERNTMQNLGVISTPQGTGVSDATAINNRGQIIGNSRVSYFAEVSHAILWDYGVMIDLGTLGGASALTTGINSRGLVIGNSGRTYFDEHSANHAFLWNKGSLLDIGLAVETPGPNQNSFAVAINDPGQVVGFANSGAFLWDKGKVTELGTLGGAYAYPVDMNNQSQVVGYSDTAMPGETHAFLWDRGQMIDLGTLPGGVNSRANAINVGGLVIGTSDTAVPGETHAFLWSQGKMIDLGTLPGDIYSEPRAINARGQIVGISRDASGETHAVLWVSGS